MAVIYGKTTSGPEHDAPKEPSTTIKGKAEESSLFLKIENEIQDAIANTTEWSSKQDKWHRMRMRIKKAKNFPFVGSSNIRMPTAETNIRKVKSSIMGVIFGSRPVVQALPSPQGSLDIAQKIEKLLDHLIMDVMDVQQKAEIAVDQSLECGFYLLKTHWCRRVMTRTEKIDLKELPTDEVMFLFEQPREAVIPEIVKRFDIDLNDSIAEDNLKAIEKALDEVLAGKDYVEFNVQDVIYNFPDVSLVPPNRCYVPTDSGFDPQFTASITHEFFLTLDEIKRNAEYKGWKNVEKIDSLKEVQLDDAKDIEKNAREGIQRLQGSGLVRVWETYGYYDIGNKVKQHSVVTSFPDFKIEARKVLLDTLSGKRPFVKLYYELTDDRWFAHRGIPELLEDIIKEIDTQHNMKIDSQTIRNAPMFIYRAGMINPNLVQMIPNQAIPVNGMQPLNDTIDVLNLHNPNTEFSYEREQMILETKVQELIGQIDYGLQSMINRRQPRTLGEVDQQTQAASRVFSLDASHYVQQFSELFSQIFESWCKYGDDAYEFNYFGESLKGEKIRLTKEEIQGKYKIVVRGNDTSTNPQVKIQKAQQIMLAASNPLLVQTGVIGPQQIANSLKRFYQALDVENWEELLILQPQPPQQDPKAQIVPKFSDLAQGEQSQVLQSLGMKPDVQGRFGKQNMEVIQQAAEIADMLGNDVGGSQDIGGNAKK